MRVKSHPSRASISEQLGINLVSGKEEELFKWFLVCLLYGKPIQQEIAERAYFRLVQEKLLSPEAVLRTGWDKLVRFLDDAHYVRYDFSTAAKLLEVCEQLKERYGTLTQLMAQARTVSELRARLQEFKHVGPLTARIFCRELAPIWYRPGNLS
jgi:endonuclease III